MFRWFPVLLLLVMASHFAMGQDSSKRIKILPVPTIGYSPETRTYIGAVTLFTIDLYKDSVTRTSNAKFEFNYTWNKQLIFETEWNYFFKEEKWFTRGRIHYSEYPDYYYGIGSNTPESNKTLYNSNRLVFEANILKNLGDKLFIGPGIRYINYNNVSFTDTLNYPELADHSTFGVGITLLRDSRNNLLTATKGYYINFNAGYNFSQNNYVETTLDLRIYKTWADKFTWANRMINVFHFGNPPFYDYSFLGGDKFVRGYNYGRYRDKNLTSLQTEFRMPLFWRFGLATFGGVSNLFADNFKPGDSKFNYGLGMRFLVDKHDRTNLRLDYAIGEGENSGFYISFGESF